MQPIRNRFPSWSRRAAPISPLAAVPALFVVVVILLPGGLASPPARPAPATSVAPYLGDGQQTTNLSAGCAAPRYHAVPVVSNVTGRGHLDVSTDASKCTPPSASYFSDPFSGARVNGTEAYVEDTLGVWAGWFSSSLGYDQFRAHVAINVTLSYRETTGVCSTFPRGSGSCGEGAGIVVEAQLFLETSYGGPTYGRVWSTAWYHSVYSSCSRGACTPRTSATRLSTAIGGRELDPTLYLNDTPPSSVSYEIGVAVYLVVVADQGADPPATLSGATNVASLDAAVDLRSILLL